MLNDLELNPAAYASMERRNAEAHLEESRELGGIIGRAIEMVLASLEADKWRCSPGDRLALAQVIEAELLEQVNFEPDLEAFERGQLEASARYASALAEARA
jgi:hypothetical protein